MLFRSNIATIIALLAIATGAFWLLATPGETQQNPFATQLRGAEIQPVSCPAPAFALLHGQPVADVDLATLPHPYELFSADEEPSDGYRQRRLLIEFDANGQVTDVTCG